MLKLSRLCYSRYQDLDSACPKSARCVPCPKSASCGMSLRSGGDGVSESSLPSNGGESSSSSSKSATSAMFCAGLCLGDRSARSRARACGEAGSQRGLWWGCRRRMSGIGSASPGVSESMRTGTGRGESASTIISANGCALLRTTGGDGMVESAVPVLC